ISRGKNGQFFTPEHVCDAMSAMLINKGEQNKTILDPCCGSGRMLLSAAKISRDNTFYGADIDYRCVKMTAINLCLNALPGEVAWMNTLSMEHWGGYTIGYTDPRLRIPIITKLSANEGILYNRAPINEKAGKQIDPPKVITIIQPKLDL
ncbi:MAG: N-6 DNA methylase, partial [Bacteroidia bacterium]